MTNLRIAQEAHTTGMAAYTGNPEVYGPQARVTGKVPLHILNSKPYQDFIAAKKQFAVAFNNGVPPPDELEKRLDDAYWPQGWESPEVTKSKEKLRLLFMEGLQIQTNRPAGYAPPGLQPAPPGMLKRNDLPPPAAGAKLTDVTSITEKELADTVAYANSEKRLTPSGRPFTVEYLREYFTDMKVKIVP